MYSNNICQAQKRTYNSVNEKNLILLLRQKFSFYQIIFPSFSEKSNAAITTKNLNKSVKQIPTNFNMVNVADQPTQKILIVCGGKRIGY